MKVALILFAMAVRALAGPNPLEEKLESYNMDEDGAPASPSSSDESLEQSEDMYEDEALDSPSSFGEEVNEDDEYIMKIYDLELERRCKKEIANIYDGIRLTEPINALVATFTENYSLKSIFDIEDHISSTVLLEESKKYSLPEQCVVLWEVTQKTICKDLYNNIEKVLKILYKDELYTRKVAGSHVCMVLRERYGRYLDEFEKMMEKEESKLKELKKECNNEIASALDKIEVTGKIEELVTIFNKKDETSSEESENDETSSEESENDEASSEEFENDETSSEESENDETSSEEFDLERYEDHLEECSEFLEAITSGAKHCQKLTYEKDYDDVLDILSKEEQYTRKIKGFYACKESKNQYVDGLELECMVEIDNALDRIKLPENIEKMVAIITEKHPEKPIFEIEMTREELQQLQIKDYNVPKECSDFSEAITSGAEHCQKLADKDAYDYILMYPYKKKQHTTKVAGFYLCKKLKEEYEKELKAQCKDEIANALDRIKLPENIEELVAIITNNHPEKPIFKIEMTRDELQQLQLDVYNVSKQCSEFSEAITSGAKGPNCQKLTDENVFDYVLKVLYEGEQYTTKVASFEFCMRLKESQEKSDIEKDSITS